MPPLVQPANQPKQPHDLNREAWLTEMARALEPHYRGWDMDKYRVTCGWPSAKGLGAKARTIGQCWARECSAGGIAEIFISPLVQDPVEAGGVLAHEMAHVAAGHKAGHGPKYVRVCRHVGLTNGKPTAVMPGPLLNDYIRDQVLKLGPYPHRAIVPVLKERKVKAGPVKLQCGNCGCQCTMTPKWHESSGSPTCGCGHPMKVKADEEEGGE